MRTQPASEPRSVVDDAIRGIQWGLTIAGILTLVAVIAIPLNGGLILRTKHGMEFNILVAIVLYFVTGVVAGAVAGAFRPLLRSRAGAAFVGVLGMAPMGVGTVIALEGPTQWATSEILTAVSLPILLGAPLGIVLSIFVQNYNKD